VDSVSPDCRNQVFGFQDTQTGVFHPANRPVPSTVTTTPFTYIGTYEFTFVIDQKTTFPSGTKFYCGAEVIVSGYYDETRYAEATSATSCKVNIPYRWVLPKAPAGDVVDFEMTVRYYVLAAEPTLQEPIALGETTGTILSEYQGVPTAAITPYQFDVDL
jgi:hypothetical protein